MLVRRVSFGALIAMLRHVPGAIADGGGNGTQLSFHEKMQVVSAEDRRQDIVKRQLPPDLAMQRMRRLSASDRRCDRTCQRAGESCLNFVNGMMFRAVEDRARWRNLPHRAARRVMFHTGNAAERPVSGSRLPGAL
jgi:hypothetical protein